jgi:hypothetical protein
MARRAVARQSSVSFETVRSVGLTLPDVESTTRYDGAPVLKVRGCFLAGVATHPSAEPGTLVVRSTLEDRAWLLDEAPETYYLTNSYRKYPVILVRLARLPADALRDLLVTSWRLTIAKAPRRAGGRRRITKSS